MTDQPERVVGLVSTYDLQVLTLMRAAYQAMTVLLLGHIDPTKVDEQNRLEALEYLRGYARIGIETPPTEEDGKTLHYNVMAVLGVLGEEPITSEELAVVMAAGHELQRRRATGGSPVQ